MKHVSQRVLVRPYVVDTMLSRRRGIVGSKKSLNNLSLFLSSRVGRYAFSELDRNCAPEREEQNHEKRRVHRGVQRMPDNRFQYRPH